jgi:hypothetical protein
MDPYSSFQSLRTLLVLSGLTFTFAGARLFQDRLPKGPEALIEYLIIVIYAAIPFAVWAIVVYVAMPLLLETPFFRRLVLGRRRYIEGTWIQFSDEPDSKKGLSILDIQPHRDSFTFTGVHFRIEENQGNIGKPFRIVPISFEWPTLRYCYLTAASRPGESPDAEGLGTYTFVPAKEDSPVRFDGQYVYGGFHGTTFVSGFRATPEQIDDLQDSERRTVLIRKLLAKKITSAGPDPTPL